MKTTIESFAQEILEDFKQWGQQTSEEAKQVARETAEILESVGRAGASQEMEDAAKHRIALKWSTLGLKVEQQVLAARVDGWVIASKVLFRLLDAMG